MVHLWFYTALPMQALEALLESMRIARGRD